MVGVGLACLFSRHSLLDKSQHCVGGRSCPAAPPSILLLPKEHCHVCIGYVSEAVGSGMGGIKEEDTSMNGKIDGANVSATPSVAGTSYRWD